VGEQPRVTRQPQVDRPRHAEQLTGSNVTVPVSTVYPGAVTVPLAASACA
jgi:hypothetical protein